MSAKLTDAEIDTIRHSMEVSGDWPRHRMFADLIQAAVLAKVSAPASVSDAVPVSWQPWLTAPKDRSIIVYGGVDFDTPVSIEDGSPSAQVIAAWNDDLKSWWYATGFVDSSCTDRRVVSIPLEQLTPTHWRELDAAPTQSTQQPDAGEPVDVDEYVAKHGDIVPSPVAPVRRKTEERIVTRESAVEAIAHVAQYNGSGREEDALAMLVPVPAPQVARQYFYKMTGCQTEVANDAGCICWHDVGAGPLKGREATATSWRDKPAPQVAQGDEQMEIEALRDMLESARQEYTDVREALGVSYEPHQCLHERVIEAALSRQPSAGDAVNQFMADVATELKRARAKFPGDRIMTIALAEEFGELAKAMLEECGANVWKEAVQTAVMAARVAIDGDSSVDEWRATKGLDNHRAAFATSKEKP
jgi:hypothetical protein